MTLDSWTIIGGIENFAVKKKKSYGEIGFNKHTEQTVKISFLKFSFPSFINDKIKINTRILLFVNWFKYQNHFRIFRNVKNGFMVLIFKPTNKRILVLIFISSFISHQKLSWIISKIFPPLDSCPKSPLPKQKVFG